MGEGGREGFQYTYIHIILNMSMHWRKIIQRAFRFHYTHFATFLQTPPGPPTQRLLPFCRPPSPSPFTYLGSRRLNQFKCLRYPRPYRSDCCESCIVMQIDCLLCYMPCMYVYSVYTFLLYIYVCMVCMYGILCACPTSHSQLAV